MRTRIQQWGNSLALRIPKSFAAEAHPALDAPVGVSVVEGKLVVAPIAEPAFTLERLLAGVTEQNLHREVATGEPVGDEVSKCRSRPASPSPPRPPGRRSSAPA